MNTACNESMNTTRKIPAQVNAVILYRIGTKCAIKRARFQETSVSNNLYKKAFYTVFSMLKYTTRQKNV